MTPILANAPRIAPAFCACRHFWLVHDEQGCHGLVSVAFGPMPMSNTYDRCRCRLKERPR